MNRADSEAACPHLQLQGFVESFQHRPVADPLHASWSKSKKSLTKPVWSAPLFCFWPLSSLLLVQKNPSCKSAWALSTFFTYVRTVTCGTNCHSPKYVNNKRGKTMVQYARRWIGAAQRAFVPRQHHGFSAVSSCPAGAPSSKYGGMDERPRSGEFDSNLIRTEQ
ncbi:hypothetical protein BJX63DRAFT_354602 [Aspergillus granulosus]|uniref:Uncharacterized protein n=1 Tax=Aspergillus granulosus TaxID=176169 RepID=A0ABR4H1X9_9EURO